MSEEIKKDEQINSAEAVESNDNAIQLNLNPIELPENNGEIEKESVVSQAENETVTVKEKKKPGTIHSIFNMLWNPKDGEVHFSRGVTLVLFGLITINFGLYFLNAFESSYYALFSIIQYIPDIMGQPSELLQTFASIMVDSFLSGGDAFNVINWFSLSVAFVIGCDILLIILHSIRHIKNPFGKDAWSYGVARMFVPSLCFLSGFILSTFFGLYCLSVLISVLGCFMLGYNIASTIDLKFYYLELPLIFVCILFIVIAVFYIVGKTVDFDITFAIQQALDALQTLMDMYGI